MPPTKQRLWLLVRFAVNGAAATGLHFSVLWFIVSVLGWHSAGASNLVAALFGISLSFLGNRYWVFRTLDEPLLSQLSKFVVLYAILAGLQGGLLFVWTDLAHGDYRLGFLVATALQTIVSYFGNRRIVFRQAQENVEGSP